MEGRKGRNYELVGSCLNPIHSVKSSPTSRKVREGGHDNGERGKGPFPILKRSIKREVCVGMPSSGEVQLGEKEFRVDVHREPEKGKGEDELPTHVQGGCASSIKVRMR